MVEYTKSLVGFYDILGFGEFVQQHPDAESVFQLFSAIRDNFSFGSYESEEFGQRFSHFSDTVIRSTPFILADGKKNDSGMLFHEMLDAASFQINLVWKELVWVRGAITFGGIHHDTGGVFGPAVIQAYRLEREAALYPRIIVDPKLLAEFEVNPALRSWHNPIKYEREHCYDLLRKGDDGIWFVDYLGIAREEIDDPDRYPDFLAKHKNLILKRLGKENEITRVNQKYTWLTQYHNTVVRGLSKEVLKRHGYSMNDILITSDEAPLCFQPPSTE